MIKHVKATGLSSVFQGLDPVVFTDEAKNKGVNNNSIIYITCGPDDVEKFGIQFVEGSKWIWAQGEWYGTYTIPITNEQLEQIFIETDPDYQTPVEIADEFIAEELSSIIG